MKGYVIAIVFIPMVLAAGRYKRLKSREGRVNNCPTRLAPKIYKIYSKGSTCENGKACKANEICACTEHCGKICIDLRVRIKDHKNSPHAAGRYKRLKSREGRVSNCSTRLAPKIYKIYSKGSTCENDKACKANEICACTGHCGKICIDLRVRIKDHKNSPHAARHYKRLKSREGQVNNCPTRLVPTIFKRFCKGSACENDKACKANEICACTEHCGKICRDPTFTCHDGPCKNGGTCLDIQGKATCSCPANFMGPTCETNVDECLLSNPCKNGAMCIDVYGGYFCRCTSAWEGFDCSINKDDCITQPDGSPPCLNNGTCVDKVGKYDCICKPGWTGMMCQHIDQCYSNPCYGAATCQSDPFGRYCCRCPKGWSGKNCSTDDDECAIGSSSPCHHGGTCVDRPGSFVCQCAPGYTGERCDVYTDECASNPCKNSATCVDYVTEFRCFCQPGWTGKTCDVDINECSSNPCKNDGQCVNELNGYSCKCKLAFSGTNCAINIEDGSTPNKDVCITQADGSSPCLNGGICVHRVGKYDCICRPGWTGPLCQFIDQCYSNPCYGAATCLKDCFGRYRCRCPKGWTGKNCSTNI